jgi:putative tricarboxylic transport membrane protein
VLAALGVFALVEASRLRDDWQGARLMPVVVGVVLVVLGLAHLRAPGEPTPVAWDPGARRRVLAMFATLALYVAGLPVIGFVAATALFILILLLWLGDFSWPVTLATTMTVAVASHLVFQRWLGMPLPSGPFGQ